MANVMKGASVRISRNNRSIPALAVKSTAIAPQGPNKAPIIAKPIVPAVAAPTKAIVGQTRKTVVKPTGKPVHAPVAPEVVTAPATEVLKEREEALELNSREPNMKKVSHYIHSALALTPAELLIVRHAVFQAAGAFVPGSAGVIKTAIQKAMPAAKPSPVQVGTAPATAAGPRLFGMRSIVQK